MEYQFAKGQTTAELAVVTTDAAGDFVIASSTPCQFLVDVSGYFSTADPESPGRYVAIRPARLLDTRTRGPALAPRTSRSVKVTGIAGVPSSGVSAVVLNATDVGPTSGSHLTVYSGGTRPTVSTVNVVRGVTRANRTIVAPSSSGTVSVYNSAGTANLLVDVTGYFTTGATGAYFVPVGPTRLDNTRGATLPRGPRTSYETIAGNHFLPVRASMMNPVAVVASLTTLPTPGQRSAGHATLWAGGRHPRTSDLNYSPRYATGNLAIVTVGSQGTISILESRATYFTLDVTGYFSLPLPATTPAGLWQAPPYPLPEVPIAASAEPDVRAVVDSTTWTTMLHDDGTVWQTLGFDFSASYVMSEVSQVAGLSGIVAIAGGHATAYALRNDGTVWAWGNGVLGQLGDGNTTTSSTPVQVSHLTGVVAIGAAYAGGYAITADGALWAWGANGDGEVGDGTEVERPAPVLIAGLSHVVAVAGGGDEAEAVEADGSLWRWGAVYVAGGTTVTPSPERVSDTCPAGSVSGDPQSDRLVVLCRDGTTSPFPGLDDVIAVSSTLQGIAFLREDGTVWIIQAAGFAPIPGLDGITGLGTSIDGWVASAGG